MTPEELKEAISSAEGTSLDIAGGFGYESPYDVTLDYGAYDPYKKPITQMTLGELDQFQTEMLKNENNKHNSSAAGKYQIVQKTLRDLKNQFNLSNDLVYTPELQEDLANKLLVRRGLNKFRAGEMEYETFQNNLSNEWASLPKFGKQRPTPRGYDSDVMQEMLRSLRGDPNTEATPENVAALGIDPDLLSDPDLFSKTPSAIPESSLSTVDSMGFDDFGITYDPIELPYAERPEIGGGYTVNQGDTLYSISQRIGVPVEEIARRNNIMNNMIFPGQRLLY